MLNVVITDSSGTNKANVDATGHLNVAGGVSVVNPSASPIPVTGTVGMTPPLADTSRELTVADDPSTPGPTAQGFDSLNASFLSVTRTATPFDLCFSHTTYPALESCIFINDSTNIPVLVPLTQLTPMDSINMQWFRADSVHCGAFVWIAGS